MNSSGDNAETLLQMSEVLKKLNLGEASNHFIKYMGKQYKPAGHKSKEDESIKKLRNCNLSSDFSSPLPYSEKSDSLFDSG